MKYMHIEKAKKTVFHEFILVDERFPDDHWPRVSETYPLLFAGIPDDLMENIYEPFNLTCSPDLYDFYGLSYYQKKRDLREAITNLQIFTNMVTDMTKKEFLLRFEPWIFFPYLSEEQVPDQWRVLQSDLIETLEIIRNRAQEAIKGGKIFLIVGV